MLSIDKDKIMIENYQTIDSINHHEIIVTCKHQLVKICGEALHIVAMSKDEIMIRGKVMMVIFDE